MAVELQLGAGIIIHASIDAGLEAALESVPLFSQLRSVVEYVANFEVRSECSVVADDLVLRLKHHKGAYRARIKNIPRDAYTTPFLLSVHLYFEAAALEEAKEVAGDHLASCLNLLTFATGSSFWLHRTRQIVDATPGLGVRDMLFWGDAVEYEDPQPLLDQDTAKTIERIMEFDAPPPIRRALRWYRLGVNAAVPDDQFVNFWFALELIAEYKKSPEKVPDRCPKCRAPLFCESCKTHPVHKPYAKQAIRDVLNAADKNLDDATFSLLDKTRNSLMHGSTPKEIEASLPQPHEEVVDVLGRLLWKALIHDFPPEMFDGSLSMGVPSTYVQRTLRGIAHIQTVAPTGPDGDLDLSFKGMTVALLPPGPPQSANPSFVRMASSQHERLGQLAFAKGDGKEMCERIYRDSRKRGDRVMVRVLSTDMARIKDALKRSETGAWQDFFKEVLQDPA